MSSYLRRFSFDPGNDVLLNIESINILDLTPPSALSGIGTGTVMVVGEFENGPYNYPLEVSGDSDFKRNFGSLGYTYAGVQCNNPSAIARHADGAGAVEYWNGHGLVQLNGKQFSRLLVTRANTSVGSVNLTPLAFVGGTVSALAYGLQPGQVLGFDIGAGPQTATFNAAPATVTSSGAAFASINPGDTVTLGADAKANFTATFLSGDNTQLGVIARINQYAGFPFATLAGGLTSVTVGTNGQGYTGVASVNVGAPQSTAGVQATATATMGVYQLILASGGNYGGTPTVTVTGGGGTGATATLTMVSTAVATLTITAHGTGFTSAPTVAFVGGSPVTAAVATATLGVLSVAVGTAGSGYTSVPPVTFSGAGGNPQATATGVMGTTAIALVSQVQGTSAQVRVVSSSTAGVLTNLGLTAATTTGTGNVANIQNVQQTEVQAVVTAANANVQVTFDSQQRIRLANANPSALTYLAVTAATTATAFGLPTTVATGSINTQQGQAIVLSGPVTLPPNAADTVTLGIDAQPNVVVTFAGTETTTALLIAAINAAFVAAGQVAIATADGATQFYLQSQLQKTSAAQVRVQASSSQSVLTKLGLSLGATLGTGITVGLIPAGTVVQVPGTMGPVFVTTQDVNITANGIFVGGNTPASGGVQQPIAGPFAVPIRHALDDGSGAAAGAGAVTQITNAPDIGAFSCINLGVTTPALTEGQIDAAYVTAIAATVNINTVAKQTNIIFAVRQSIAIRAALRTNAIQASTSGCFGRVCCIRPPLNTSEATALGLGAPGVGATRDERTLYCYIGSNVYVPLIGVRGLAGNPVNTNYLAFTSDGNVDVGSDSLMASILSQLPPEENPGQDTPFSTVVNGIEKGVNVQSFQMQDYILFKAAGIAALRVDDGLVSFQSGVTSVDPNVYPSLTTIARRRMADYIQDSLAIAGKPYGKKLMTAARRHAYTQEVTAFLRGLLSVKNPQFQRIAGYTVDAKTANTTQTLGRGLFRLKIAVKTLPSMDSIVLETTVGTLVSVLESLPQAA